MKDLKVHEIRASLLFADENAPEDKYSDHVKHVSVVVTDPALCELISKAIAGRIDLDKVKDGHHELIESKKKDSPELEAAKENLEKAKDNLADIKEHAGSHGKKHTA